MFGFTKELKEYLFSSDELDQFNYAKFTLDNGVIWIKLNTNDVTNTVSNFVSLANDAFYDGLNFHRVIPGFMAQGGCPDGTGAGGPEWSIACETDANGQVHNKGSISMAHAGKDTGGSQFFICFVACPHLDGGHTVFGNIEANDNSSFETLDAIQQNDSIVSVEILASRD
ncbi:MAG: peptidylprolyl isomerase [Campylobacteraceae bacterium]|jgi:peptidyl-prolyl cis-trans isomerase B (cyclophilin B)|nr:peptidylprolyl isomerase [Campylobacteraceae bacterium]